VFRNGCRSDLRGVLIQYKDLATFCRLMDLGTPSITAPSVHPCLQPQELVQGSMRGVFDLPTMASQTHVPNSHRKYDIEADGIEITGHTPPKRLGANARDITNWTRSGGKSKDDAFMVEDDDEVQEIYGTSSQWHSRPGTSRQTATNFNMVVSTTPVFLAMNCLRSHLRIQPLILRRPKPRIRTLKGGTTLAPPLQQPLVHAITVPNPYNISLLEVQGLILRLCPADQA
jgi:hypothetical protein